MQNEKHLIKQALEKSMMSRGRQLEHEESKDELSFAGTAVGSQDTPAELLRLQEWSKKTGLSIDTLRIIQAKQAVIKKQKEEVDRTMVQSEGAYK